MQLQRYGFVDFYVEASFSFHSDPPDHVALLCIERRMDNLNGQLRKTYPGYSHDVTMLSGQLVGSWLSASPTPDSKSYPAILKAAVDQVTGPSEALLMSWCKVLWPDLIQSGKWPPPPHLLR
jgi:hypothetical protein